MRQIFGDARPLARRRFSRKSIAAPIVPAPEPVVSTGAVANTGAIEVLDVSITARGDLQIQA